MHTIPASEVKRRGVAALDEALKFGPVHIIKNNRPRYVVLSEEDYQVLASSAALSARVQETQVTRISGHKSDAALSSGPDRLPSPPVRLGLAEGRYSIPAPNADEDAHIAELFGAEGIFPSADGNS